MKDQKKINFILPFKPRRPAGGFKIMYEYANRLAQKGYKVHLIFPIETAYMKYRLPYFARRVLSLAEGFRRDKWFDFDPLITMSYVPRVEDKYIPDADIVIATWWSTVLEMGKLSASKGKKINLIQGFENWEGREELLYHSYDLPDITNIVVAAYLKEIVAKYTKKQIIVIPNAINTDQFKISKPIDSRADASICMVYSIQEIKGSDYGVKALELVKKQIPELRVELFGVCPQPENIPTEWMTFVRNPSDLPELYNRNAIFISNSFTEGFGLVSVESMACGCALICTDIQGHSEYAKDGETALLYEAKNVDMLAEKIIYLIKNKEPRNRLAMQGNAYVQRFSWDNAIEQMEGVILKL